MKRVLAALAVVACIGSRASAEAPASPNIILILTDDQGWADLDQPLDPAVPAARCPLFQTPNMDRLARQGMRFTDGYAAAPICTPSRRSLQFGMTPARQHGTEFASDFHPKGHLSIPQALKRANPDYRCAHFGKWGELMTGRSYAEKNVEAHPTALGYDESDGITGNSEGTSYHPVLQKADFYRNWICEPDKDPKRTFSVTRRAISFMERQVRDKHPFYLQASYYAVHTAYQALPETIAKYAGRGEPDRQVKAGLAPMLEDLDTGIGELLAAVDRLGIADNTYVFLTSDNGGEAQPANTPVKPGTPARNYPLRKYKQYLYEGGIRVPLAVRGPGIKADSLCAEPVAQYDLLSTFYDLAGGREPLPSDVDGTSLGPLLQNEGHGTLHRAIPALIFHRPLLRAQSHSAIRMGDYKLVVTWKGPWQPSRRELFRLGTDIGESDDLSASMHAKTEELYGTLVSYLRSVDAEMPPEGGVPPKQKSAPGEADPGGSGRNQAHKDQSVSRLARTVMIDGRLSEWPTSDPKRSLVLPAVGGGGPPSHAWIGYDDSALYVAVSNPVDNAAELKTPRKPPDNYDRMLLAVQDASGNKPGPTLILMGFPDGRFKTTNFANAPAEAVGRMQRMTTFAAAVTATGWDCEWRIPFEAIGVDANKPPKLNFNMVVKKTQPTVSCLWTQTGGPAWQVEKARALVFER